MENNHFEKQVREKLTGLKIQPSEKAWRGIESRIGKKDSRRKILWLFFIGIFLVAGGIFLFQMNDSSRIKTISHLPETNIKSGTITGSKSGSSDSVFMPEINKADKHLNSSLQNSGGSNGQTIIALKSPDKILPRTEKEISKNKAQEVQSGQTVSSETDVQVSKPMIRLPENKLSADFSTEVNPEKVNASLNSIENKPGKEVIQLDSSNELKSSDVEMSLIHPLIDKERQDEMDQPFTKNLPNTSDLSKNIKLVSSSAKKWEMGFTMAAAKYFFGDGINVGLGLDKNYASGDLSYNNPGPSTGSGNYQPVTGPPSDLKNSVEFKTGFILRKPISRKRTFSTGIEYAYYTNTILIGEQIPSGNYSSVGMLASYRNNIHFIELPLSMRFQLTNQAAIPLHLSAGITMAQLIFSDAMQYKGGFYSVDNSFFNRTQIGFDAGVSATFFNKLSVGPYYNYGINQFGKDGFYGKKHLNSYGLKVDFILRKK